MAAYFCLKMIGMGKENGHFVSGTDPIEGDQKLNKQHHITLQDMVIKGTGMLISR